MKITQKEQTLLLQVDALDNPIGLVDKKKAHLRGILHRGFSIFIFREVESSIQLLLQQRAFHKYHSGGLWSNTCCSHAEPDVPLDVTAQNRLQIEMGFSCPLSCSGFFYYKTDVGNGMVEHEIDHVFASFHNPTHIYPNPEESIGFKWVDIKTISHMLTTNSFEFTSWFPKAFALSLGFLETGLCASI